MEERGQERADGADRRIDPGAAVRQNPAVRDARDPQRHRHQDQREADGDEVGDPPVPHQIPDRFEGRGVPVLEFLGLQPRAQRRADQRARARGHGDLPTRGGRADRLGHAVRLRLVLALDLRREDGEPRRQGDRGVAIGAGRDAVDDALVDLHLQQQPVLPA
jgi:hypothetical protein